MSRPFVSVLIDAYNHERFIEEALRSVLAQVFPPAECEMVVVDDGPADRTPDLMRQFEPPKATVHTPTDAIGTFFSSGMDALVLGSFLVERSLAAF